MNSTTRKPVWASPLVAAVIWLSGCGPDDAFSPPPPPPPALTSFEAMEQAIGRGTYGDIRAVIVQKSDTRLYTNYFSGAASSERVDVRSVGKSITALAVGKALEQGALPSLDLQVWDYLIGDRKVANDSRAKREITVRDLLSMSSALDCNDWISKSPGNEERMYDRRNWTAFALDLPTDPMFQRRPDGQGRFSYCTAGVFLLGRVVEKATGERFDAFVQAEIFEPMQISDVRWRVSPAGEIQSGGQIEMRPEDLLRIGQMIMAGGEFAGQQVVETDWLREMMKPRNGVAEDMDYAYLWWTRNFRSGSDVKIAGAFMSGNGGNIVLLLPALDTVIVIAAENYNQDDAFANSIFIVEKYLIPELIRSEN
ncbi:serine hydrolase [Erythrobacter sp.]|uniref:serine hydrolase domain-containing protein n=1 Tax=Erythrobacter sp. TaxID=1042 RepID=UPI0025D9E935|nr:serine hydrolase [Erythrobacter sp.]